MRRNKFIVRRSNRFGRFFGIMLLLAVVGFVGYSQLRVGVRASEPTGPIKSVIVKMKGVDVVSSANELGREQQKSAIQQANLALNNVVGGYIEKQREFTNLPFAVYTVDAAGESALRSDPRVASVTDDQYLETYTTLPIPTIGGSAVNGFSDGTSLFTGNGYAVAVIDTGVDKNHPGLAGKVIAEACFGTNQVFPEATVASLCPGAATTSTAPGSGQDCTLSGCGHGTAVAGAAAMIHGSVDIDLDSSPDDISGSALDAKIVAVKVAASVTETDTGVDICGDTGAVLSTCAVPRESLYLAGLDYVANLSASHPIAAANLSIGGDPFASLATDCDETGFNAVAVTLRAHNIAPVVAAGNSGDNPSYYDKIASPACASSAIAVAATNVAGTTLASYSNNGPLTDLLAPGGDFVPGQADSMLWLPENGTSNLVPEQGTSFAAPMVAGAYAVLREAHPNATVDQLTTLLQTTGTSVNDVRTGYTVGAKKLIQLDAALAAASAPIISTFTGPSGTVNEGTNITLNIAAANVSSCSLNNGVGAVSVTGTSTPHVVPAKASYTLTCQGSFGDTVSQVLNFTFNSAPTQPLNVVGSGNNDARTYLVQWDASSDTDGIENYLVYVNGELVATLDASTHSYLISNVLFGEEYSVEVRAVDTLGAMSIAGTLTFTITSSGLTTLGVPNTGANPLKTVQLWQLLAVAGGVMFMVAMFARRPSQVRSKSRR